MGDKDINWNEKQKEVNTPNKGYHWDVSKAISVCYKPFDIVKDKNGNLGMILDSSINNGQDILKHQISYSVDWFDCNNHRSWWDHQDLTYVNNIFLMMALNNTNNYKEDTIKILFGGAL